MASLSPGLDSTLQWICILCLTLFSFVLLLFVLHPAWNRDQIVSLDNQLGREDVSGLFVPRNISTWGEDVRNRSVDEIQAWAWSPNPVTSSFLQKNIKSIVAQAYAKDPNNTEAVLDWIYYLPGKLAGIAREDFVIAPEVISRWARSIRTGTIRDVNLIIRYSNSIKTAPILLDIIPKLVSESLSSNPENMNAIYGFIDHLSVKSLALAVYRALFAGVDHRNLEFKSVRLIYKMHEASIKFNESPEDDLKPPSFRNFLANKVHSKFLRLIRGEFFNLDACHRLCGLGNYVKLVKNPQGVSILLDAIVAINSTATERKGGQWLWQMVPVPGSLGEIFYIRNKLNVLKHVHPESFETSESGSNYVMLLPEKGKTFVRQPGSPDYVDANLFYMWSTKHRAYYSLVSSGVLQGPPHARTIQTANEPWFWKPIFN